MAARPSWRSPSVHAALALATALLLVFTVQPTAGAPLFATTQLIVGFDGPINELAIALAGGTVVREIVELGLAVVQTVDPLGLSAALLARTDVAFVETDDPLHLSGSTWDGSTWDGSTWDGSTWDASTWDASTWDGSTWDASTWDASTWDGSTWDASTWDGSTWDGSTWDGSSWNIHRGKGGWGLEDPYYRLQWGLGAVNAPDAWSVTRGGGERLCVLDTGIDMAHADLATSLFMQGASFVAFSAMLDTDDPLDYVGHGSHVAGIAAAKIGNGVGGAGLAAAEIVSVKVMDPAGGTESDLAQGLKMCWQKGARVATMSLHVTEDSPALARALEKAHDKGMLLIAAAGNDGGSVAFPASHPDVVAVGAIDAAGRVPAFSNGGAALDLVAPGVHIVSTFRGGGYASGSGTSQAVPFVAGAALLALAASPDLKPRELADHLTDSARDVGAAGWDARSGHGVVDAAALLQAFEEAPKSAKKKGK